MHRNEIDAREIILAGAVVGDFVAAVFGIFLFFPFPFSHDLHLYLITIGFWVCPFYILMYMTLVHSIGAVVAIGFVGNALLYGGIAVLIRLVCKLFRVGGAAPDNPRFHHGGGWPRQPS